MRAGLLLSAVASASLATGLSAQGTPSNADSTCTKSSDGRVECRVYRRQPGDSARRNMVFFKMDSAMANRAALGIELRATGTKRDTLGVFVEAVTPKGPAEISGIVEGDRIAAINGVDVRTSVADAEDEYANEVASRRLTREVRKLTPGTRVTLRVYSGGRFRDVQVTTGKASDVMRLSNQGRWAPMGGMRIDGPGGMMFAPEMQLMRERMPMMKERLEPMLREQFRDLPKRIEFRTAPRFKTAFPIGRVITLDDAPELDEPIVLDLDDLPFDYDDFDDDVEPISPGEIRELVGIAAQDAQAVLAHLAADGIA
ncbi:MAG: PDZ domain-containing protein [Gemmatimonadaceae bacterium]